MAHSQIVGYAFEPEYSAQQLHAIALISDAEDSDDRDSASPTSSRIENADWCVCSNCRVMPSADECFCCAESDAVVAKADSMGHVGCITSSERFRTLCLDEDVLTLALMTVHDTLRKGPLDNPIQNRSMRLAAYRYYSYWIHGKLGRRNRKPVPSCVANKIRERYPEADGNYEGFHTVGNI